MRRYIITSDKFSGTVELLYKEFDGDMLIARIDFMNSGCNSSQIEKIKERVPLSDSIIARAFIGLPVDIVAAEVIVVLEDFKREYPYQRNMHLLPPIWEKMTTADRIIACSAAADYRKYLQRNSWCNPKIAASWLKEKQYLNNWKKL